MAEIKIGRVRLALRGSWLSTASDYTSLDTVSYEGSTWIARKDVPQGTVPNSNNEEFWLLAAERGDNGTNGTNGTNGATGPQGIQGIQGPTGATGPQGIQGEIGPRPEHEWGNGTTTSIYSIRFKQTDGAWGSWHDIRGAVGATGATGATGPQGPQGNVGPKGAQGDTGPTGATGATGPQGPQGVQGVKGNTGPTGPQGIQGEVGPRPEHEWGTGSNAYSLRLQEADGTWGDWANIRGPQGATGPQGVQGPQGTKGNTGSTGATGPQGPSGPQGPAGTTTWAGLTDKPSTATRWPTFAEVTGKPAQATRWPTASEIGGFPNVTEYSYLLPSTVGGTNNAITLTSPSGRAAVTTLNDYDKVVLTVKSTTTSTVTIKIDSMSTVTVANVSAAVRLYATAIAEFLYMGGKFYLVNQYNPKTGNSVSSIGEIVLSTTSVLKKGEVYLNGATLNREDHPIAFAIASSSSNYISQATKDANLVGYGAYWGDGNGTTTFTLPLISDKFVKASGGGREAFSYQATDNLSHAHSMSSSGAHSHIFSFHGMSGALYGGGYNAGFRSPAGTYTGGTSEAGAHGHTIYASGGSEARPNNYALPAKTQL